ncbi:MAG: hypothetical protein FI702_02600 [SAR202 cluster bacterium]|nr:hypothetical protein [SAR202 cluster bacterium]|tara:strand:- start:10418 stop:10891 length:474 start_codon:yes stop_codon:yes gene_type:complete
MAAVAGQAVGPALSGSIIGSAGLVVEQAVVLDTDFEILDSGFSAGCSDFDDFIGMMNDDGTFFTIGIETKVGQIGEVVLPLNNLTNTDAHAILHLIVSPGIDVDADSDIGVDETIQRPIVWLLSVAPDGGCLYIAVEGDDQALPAFYTISGRILQVE